MAILRYSLVWGVGLLAVIGLTVVLHLLMTRIFLKTGKTWWFRQSVAVMGIVCAFVITAIDMTAAVQEYYGITRPEEKMTERWSMGKRIDETGRPIDEVPGHEAVTGVSP
jgi:hypothetical protein